MTKTSHNHRPTVVVAAAGTALIGALLGVTVNSAHAIPEPINPPPVVDRMVVHANAHYVERACFIKPPNWNEGLDGPLPRCYTYVP